MAIALVYRNNPRENCYVDLGVALFDMTHAGQESHALSVADGRHLKSTHGAGVIDLMGLDNGLNGFAGVGRNSSKHGVEPVVSYSTGMGSFSLAFDGYILNGTQLREDWGGESDAELAARFIADAGGFEKGVANLAEAAKGHFCVTLVAEDGQAYAARSPLGVRTLIYGESQSGRAVVSESRALSHIGMKIERNLEAGEIARIDGSGLHTMKKLPGRRHVCSFLWPYYQMPDCVVEGIPVALVKDRIGGYLGRMDKADGIEIDVACPVPDSGKGYEEGYAETRGCAHAELLKKYQYAGRSYDRPGQPFRDRIAGVKLTVIPHKVRGKRVAAFDDSIRRGTQLVREGGPIDLLKSAGPREIHVRICSPRNIMYCRCSPPEGSVYEDHELAANRFPDDMDLANYFDPADKKVKSVRFIGIEPFVSCITEGSSLTRDDLCLGCYTGDFGFLE